MIAALLDALIGPLGALLAAVVTIGGAWFAGTRKGRQGEKSAAETRDLRGNIKTRERMDDAEIFDDHDLARRWLQSRDPDQR